MKNLKISELKAGLSKALERVEAGEEILVTDHNRPIARLSSVKKVPPLPKEPVVWDFERSVLKKGSLSSHELIRKIRDEE